MTTLLLRVATAWSLLLHLFAVGIVFGDGTDTCANKADDIVERPAAATSAVARHFVRGVLPRLNGGRDTLISALGLEDECR